MVTTLTLDMAMSARPHWRYLEVDAKRAQGSCRQRNNIIDECPEQILTYHGYGVVRQTTSIGYGPAGYGTLGGFSRNFYGMPSYSPYDICNFGDRIGATVRYNFNNNLSIEVSVENRWLPSR